jgi:hypothetical protein
MPYLVLDGNRVVARAINGYCRDVRRRGHDLTPVWDDALEVLYRNEMEVFRKEGAVDGEPRWPKLSRRPIRFHKIKNPWTKKWEMASYEVWKILHYPGRKIGHLTGKLLEQVTGISGDAEVRRGPRRLVFGTKYEDYNGVPGRPRSPGDKLTGDLGGIMSEGRDDYFPMEAREIFRITEASREEIGECAVDYLFDAPRRP